MSRTTMPPSMQTLSGNSSPLTSATFTKTCWWGAISQTTSTRSPLLSIPNFQELSTTDYMSCSLKTIIRTQMQIAVEGRPFHPSRQLTTPRRISRPRKRRNSSLNSRLYATSPPFLLEIWIKKWNLPSICKSPFKLSVFRYDFDSDGYITPEDIRIMMSYMPFNRNVQI